MSAINELQNNIFNSTMNIFNSLSFYSPIIICVSIVIFSMFTATMEKVFVFFVWIYIITFIRIIVFKRLSSGKEQLVEIPNIGLTGLKEFLYPKKNQKDYDSFMEKYKEYKLTNGIKFNAVERIEDLLELVFE